MPSTVLSDACRVSVQTQAGRLDLVLPANIVVAALVPPIADMASSTGHARDVPVDWQLCRADGRPLSQRHSLHDNGIRDGDLLALIRARPVAPPAHADDAIAEVALSLERYPRWTTDTAKVAGSVATLFCGGLSAYALLAADRHPAAVIAALLSLAAFVAAAACGRVYGQTTTALALGGCAVLWATAAGYLAVPGDVAAPRLMLAAAACTTASILVVRGMAVGTATFTTTASAAVLSAVAATVSALVPLPAAAGGALLVTAAIATLAFAARIAVWAGRVRVSQLPGSTTASRADPCRTHALTTGLVLGSCVAAALGAVLTTHAGAIFAIVVGLVLILRAGTHVDLVQVGALNASAAACFASAFLGAVRDHPHSAHWIGVAAAAVAAALTGLSAVTRPVSISPSARRCVELIEYGALAAILPLACWVGGAFAAVRAL